MAKDPAFLFYHHDFLIGTAFLTMEERGAYITILCFMADKGSLSLDQIKTVLPPGFELTQSLKDKFKVDQQGNFFNSRLLEEVEKRKNYCKTRNNNKLGINQHSESSRSYDHKQSGHMENVNRNVNRDIKNNNTTKAKRFVRPTIEEVKAYSVELKSTVDPETFFHTYESTDWIKANGLPVKNWKSTFVTWEKMEKQRMTSPAYAKNQRQNIDFDKMIQEDLGRIATKETVKALMMKMPKELWWKIDAFLKRRYPGGGNSFGEAMRDLEKNQMQIKDLTSGVGKVLLP